MSSSHRVRPGARDDGSTLVFAIVAVLLSASVVLPVSRYTMSVMRADAVRSDLGERTEAVKGGLRAALADPIALYQACVASGRTTAVELAVPPGLGIASRCTTTRDALQDVPSEQRYAIATVQANSQALLPPAYVAPPEQPDLAGTVGTAWCTSMTAADPATRVPCGRMYPGSGNAATAAWMSDTSAASQGSRIFLPALPPFVNNLSFAGGYLMPAGSDGPCRVFFPGRYTDDVVIADDTPVYFVSGIYYFERALRISGNANVVAGTGSTPGCVESDAVAVADAVGAPFDASSSGVGATFVFGANGRLVIDTATSGSNLRFTMNRRLVAKEDPLSVLNDVSIMSVNGVFDGTSTAPLTIPGRLQVPVSPVLTGSTSSSDPWTQFYRASNLVSTAGPPAPCALPLSNVTPSCPIVDVQLTNASQVQVKVPGYVSVPQGSVSLVVGPSSAPGTWISFGGGILAAQMSVSGPTPEFLQLGLLNPVVQKTFKIVTETVSGDPHVVSTALVQVNETGGHAVNSWVVESHG